MGYGMMRVMRKRRGGGVMESWRGVQVEESLMPESRILRTVARVLMSLVAFTCNRGRKKMDDR